MSLRIIYGRSGTGKSEYIYNEIKSKINTEEKIYIITPDQFSFTAEKKLLNLTGEYSSLNAEVLTFSRMAYRVFNETYGAVDVGLSMSGRAMLLYDILLKQKDNLTFLKNSDGDVELMANAITEFKKHNVTEDSLKNSMENIESAYLKAKLNDLSLIYSEYNKRIKEKYIDENDKLTLLTQRLEESKSFDNCLIYIDEFAGFTGQEYSVLEKLLKKAKQITVTICADSLEQIGHPESDIFYYNKQMANELKEIAKRINSKIEKEIYLDKAYRFKTEELLHLEQNLYQIPYKKYEKAPTNISLFLCENPYNEVETVARNIAKLVRDENYRYKDIAIITKDLGPYSSAIKAIFSEYEIPVFMDEKKSLSQNPIIKYVLAILDIFAKNWSYEAMFNYIKSGFIGMADSDVYKLDNYCKKWGIKGNKWYKEDWKWGDENLEYINSLRNQIVNPLLELKEKLQETKTCRKFCEELYNFWENQELVQQIEKRQEKQKVYTNGNEELWQAFQVVIKVLDEMVLVFGDEKMSFEKYRSLLKIAMQEEAIGKIPMYMDEVTIGDIERSRSHKVKAIFMIGVNDGSFLSGRAEEGFLNNEDRRTLKLKGLKLAKDTVENLYEEQFNVYKALGTAEEKLYISYVSSDKEGNAKRPSILISKLKKIFPNLTETSEMLGNDYTFVNSHSTFEKLLTKLREEEDGEKIDEIWNEVYSWYEKNKEWEPKLKTALQGLEYTNLPEKVKEKNLKKLYGKTIETSVSRLEQYRKCPFSFHLKYGLKLKEEGDFKLQSVDTGSFMHDVIDAFFEKAFQNGIKIKEIEEEEISKIVKEIIEEKLNLSKNYIYTSTPKFIALTNKLTNVIIKSIGYIIWQLQQSDFQIEGTEIEFKKYGKYEPMRFMLENGQVVELTGKIDRVDIAKTDDREICKNYRL